MHADNGGTPPLHVKRVHCCLPELHCLFAGSGFYKEVDYQVHSATHGVRALRNVSGGKQDNMVYEESEG